MTDLTETQLEIYAKKILSDYDSKTPSTIFKDRVKILLKMPGESSLLWLN